MRMVLSAFRRLNKQINKKIVGVNHSEYGRDCQLFCWDLDKNFKTEINLEKANRTLSKEKLIILNTHNINNVKLLSILNGTTDKNIVGLWMVQEPNTILVRREIAFR